MSVAGKVAIVFGATGFVGQGATDAFVKEGATVVAVGRDQKKLEALKQKLGNPAALHLIVGDYSDEQVTKTLHGNITKLLGSKPIDRTWQRRDR